jgi:transcriptional repressor NrdR
MQCTSCKYPDTHVVYVKQNEFTNNTERRRECMRCGMRFTTYERLREPKKTEGKK